jgi:hypothetical protein
VYKIQFPVVSLPFRGSKFTSTLVYTNRGLDVLTYNIYEILQPCFFLTNRPSPDQLILLKANVSYCVALVKLDLL